MRGIYELRRFYIKICLLTAPSFLDYNGCNVYLWLFFSVNEGVVFVMTKQDIADAILENRIETYVQPIYDVKRGGFSSGECLCRIRDRDGHICEPAEFILTAEKEGMILDIEREMLRGTCRCLADSRVTHSTIRFLEANLSVKKGQQKDLLDEYTRVLDEFGVDPHKVNLELTETAEITDRQALADSMSAMKKFGFDFAIDDFGTGLATLDYIADLPVSLIKFDMSMTKRTLVNKKARMIVDTVITMSHHMDIQVVMEGVENKTDFDMCVALGADYMQGFYFSKPLPITEFVKFVEKHQDGWHKE